MADDRAARVAELSEEVVRVAEMLEAAERTVASVRRRLDELGLGESVRDEFDAFKVPSDVAERLQDKLDRLAGELDNQALDPAPGANETSGSVAAGGGPLPPGDPVRSEKLEVQCPSCHRRFPSPVASDARRLEEASIDERTYVCPHCGHTDCYETWDHILS